MVINPNPSQALYYSDVCNNGYWYAHASVLDVLFKYASGVCIRKPCIHNHLQRFATSVHDGCGFKTVAKCFADDSDCS